MLLNDDVKRQNIFGGQRQSRGRWSSNIFHFNWIIEKVEKTYYTKGHILVLWSIASHKRKRCGILVMFVLIFYQFSYSERLVIRKRSDISLIATWCCYVGRKRRRKNILCLVMSPRCCVAYGCRLFFVFSHNNTNIFPSNTVLFWFIYPLRRRLLASKKLQGIYRTCL